MSSQQPLDDHCTARHLPHLPFQQPLSLRVAVTSRCSRSRTPWAPPLPGGCSVTEEPSWSHCQVTAERSKVAAGMLQRHLLIISNSRLLCASVLSEVQTHVLPSGASRPHEHSELFLTSARHMSLSLAPSVWGGGAAWWEEASPSPQLPISLWDNGRTKRTLPFSS